MPSRPLGQCFLIPSLRLLAGFMAVPANTGCPAAWLACPFPGLPPLWPEMIRFFLSTRPQRISLGLVLTGSFGARLGPTLPSFSVFSFQAAIFFFPLSLFVSA